MGEDSFSKPFGSGPLDDNITSTTSPATSAKSEASRCSAMPESDVLVVPSPTLIEDEQPADLSTPRDDAVRGPVVHIRMPSQQSLSTAGLHVQTFATTPSSEHAASGLVRKDEDLSTLGGKELGTDVRNSKAPPQPIFVEPTRLRANLSLASMTSYHSLSPGSGSTISSPALAAMTDITPLPSPVLPSESSVSWKKGGERSGSSDSLSSSARDELVSEQAADSTSSSLARPSPSKVEKGAYGSLKSGLFERHHLGSRTRKRESNHSHTRSLSEFIPEAVHNIRPVTVSATHGQLRGDVEHAEDKYQLEREHYLAEKRGFVQLLAPNSKTTFPTPPNSGRNMDISDDDDDSEDQRPAEYLVLRSSSTRREQKYRFVRPLGQGTFSKVVLATSEKISSSSYSLPVAAEKRLSPRHLVAIKIVQHGPAGGADEERIELSLKREVEMLQSISHPSLIHLEAVDFKAQVALLVLNYCPGGDLFELACQNRRVLSPRVVQRMFAELVGAVCYLHSKMIVHRDIKLENVLLNLTAAELAEMDSSFTYPYPILTLTDLGLSRTIKPPPDHLLTTRCGSDGYVAPEILMGQPYDGRQTDAWALGVLLYALMEGILPFDDPPQRPGSKANRGISKAAHRIARCDWIWYKFGDDEGGWDPSRGAEWEDARLCVEGLIKKVTRGRWNMDEVGQKNYVREAIQVEGGLRRRHSDSGAAIEEEQVD